MGTGSVAVQTVKPGKLPGGQLLSGFQKDNFPCLSDQDKVSLCMVPGNGSTCEQVILIEVKELPIVCARPMQEGVEHVVVKQQQVIIAGYCCLKGEVGRGNGLCQDFSPAQELLVGKEFDNGVHTNSFWLKTICISQSKWVGVYFDWPSVLFDHRGDFTRLVARGFEIQGKYNFLLLRYKFYIPLAGFFLNRNRTSGKQQFRFTFQCRPAFECSCQDFTFMMADHQIDR